MLLEHLVQVIMETTIGPHAPGRDGCLSRRQFSDAVLVSQMGRSRRSVKTSALVSGGSGGGLRGDGLWLERAEAGTPRQDGRP